MIIIVVRWWFKMILNIGSCYGICYGVIVCDNYEKWGGVLLIGKCYVDIFKSKFEVEDWCIFVVIEGEVFFKGDLDIFDGFFIMGSFYFVNDDIKWINDLKEFIFFLVNLFKVCIIGVCFGY